MKSHRLTQMPPELQTGDLWEVYPNWASRRASDSEVQRQALPEEEEDALQAQAIQRQSLPGDDEERIQKQELDEEEEEELPG